MRFPPAALILAACLFLNPIQKAFAVQACLTEEAMRVSGSGQGHSEIASVSDICRLEDNSGNPDEQKDGQESQKTVETTVLIMLLRAYAEALSEMR